MVPKKLLLFPVVLFWPAKLPKKLFLLPVVLFWPEFCPKKKLLIDVVNLPPPPIEKLLLFGTEIGLYKVLDPSSCADNNTEAGFRTSATEMLSKLPVKVEVVKRNPPITLLGCNKITLLVMS